MSEMRSMEMGAGKSSKMPWIVLAIVIVIIAAVAFMFRGGATGGAMMSKFTSDANSSGMQAVFLTNGQVYFGNLKENGEFIDLSDVFYLQVTPAQGSVSQSQAQSQEQQPQISLVELGGELHGPTKTMHINKTAVLFFEDMKKDAKVVAAIQQYKAGQKK